MEISEVSKQFISWIRIRIRRFLPQRYFFLTDSAKGSGISTVGTDQNLFTKVQSFNNDFFPAYRQLYSLLTIGFLFLQLRKVKEAETMVAPLKKKNRQESQTKYLSSFFIKGTVAQ
jgi:hypothetical protein